MSVQKFKTIFTWYLALVPIISIYASPIPGVNMGELLLLLFWIFLLIQKQFKTIKLDSTEIYLLCFVLFLYASFFASAFIGEFNANALIRTVRFTFYYISSIFLLRRFVNFDLLFTAVVKITVIANLYLAVQYIAFYLFGKILNGFLPFLPLYNTDYIQQDYEALYSNFFRPTSIFLEPAYFAQFSVLALCIVLWYKKNLPLAFIFTIGIIFSTSGQGIVIFSVIWGVYLFSHLLHSKKLSRKSLSRIALFVCTIPVLLQLLNTPVFQRSISRILRTGTHSASYSRMGAILAVLEEIDLPGALIGHGFGNIIEGNWTTPGLGYVLYGAGVTGLILLIFYLASAFRNGSSLARAAVLVFLLTFLESSVFMNLQILLYMALMHHRKSTEKQSISAPVPALIPCMTKEYHNV